MPFMCGRCGALYHDAKRGEKVVKRGFCADCQDESMSITYAQLSCMLSLIRGNDMFDESFADAMDNLLNKWDNVEDFELSAIWEDED